MFHMSGNRQFTAGTQGEFAKSSTLKAGSNGGKLADALFSQVPLAE
jgi:hypothetical protein